MISTLLLAHSSERAWTLFFRFLFWTPQIVWGLMAIGMLISTLASLHRNVQHGRKLWHRWFLLVPYAMTLGAVGLQMHVFGLPPFANPLEPSGPSYAMFWETVVPSLAILAILVLLHMLYPLLWGSKEDLEGNSPK